MASSTFESLFGGGIDPMLKRMVGLSALVHLSIAVLVLVASRGGSLPVDYNPAINVALVDLPEVKDLKDVKLGTPMPKQLPAPQEKKPEAKAAEPKKIPEPQKKVFSLEEEKKTTKRAAESKSRKEVSQLAKIESAVDRIRRQRVAVAKIRQRALETAGPEGTPGGSVRGFGAIRANAYNAQLVSILRENWELPNTFLGQDLHTIVFMRVDRSGQIADWRIVRGSGNPVFDDTVYRAMTKTQYGGQLPAPAPEVFETIKDGWDVDFNPESFFAGETG